MSGSQAIIDATRRWISSVVIGLNLCPFAQRVFQGDLIRYVVTMADDAEDLRTALAEELSFLAASPIGVVETTILIHPHALTRFSDYCDFLSVAERLVKTKGLIGVIQIASFHPQFQFADADVDAVENFTNRSPYPMLHLLREESVTKVADGAIDLLDIPRRNATTLRHMGREKILAMLRTAAHKP